MTSLPSLMPLRLSMALFDSQVLSKGRRTASIFAFSLKLCRKVFMDHRM